MKQHLIENVTLDTQNYAKVSHLTEGQRNLLVEGQNYKALAVYEFKFTRPNKKNLNGRVYPYNLWDNVISDNLVTVALMNHPTDAGDPKDIWAVAKNPRYSDDREFVVADCYIINNEHGRTALGVLEAGGSIGLSSSGYGDFLSDGITVDASTFELERYFDWVLAPSYEVYGVQEEKKVNESSTKSMNKREEKDTATMRKLSLREKREFEISMDKIYEHTATLVKEEKKVKAEEALTFYEDVDSLYRKNDFRKLMELADKEIEDEAKAKDKEIEENLNDKESQIKENEETIEDLKDKLDKTTKDLEEKNAILDAFTKEIKGKVSKKEYIELRGYAEKAVKLLNEKRATISKLKAQNKLISEKRVELKNKAKNRVTELTTIINESKKELKAILVEKAKLEKALKQEKQAKEKVTDAYNLLVEKEIKRHKSAVKKQEELVKSKERAYLTHMQDLESNANPEVREYYNDLVDRGENVIGLKEAILQKRTLREAQGYFLNKKQFMQTPEIKRANRIIESTEKAKSIKLPKGYL